MNTNVLYDKLRAAVIEGLEFIKANEPEFYRFNLSDFYQEYPDLGYNENGFPSFSKSRFSKRDYHGLLFTNNSYKNFISWIDVQKFLLGDENYCKYFFLGKYSEKETDKSRIFWDDFYTMYPISAIINRYIHLNETRELHEEKLKELFIEWTNYFLQTELDIDIVVPILMVTFDFDELEISQQIKVKRMSDLFQKSRNTKTSFNSSPHSNVISSATHAFILKDYSIPNNSEKSSNDLSNISCYSKIMADYIDKLFAYLRSALGIDTGYSQIIAKPNNWASSWYADLIPLHIASTKGYPEYFEDYYWNHIPLKFTSDIFKKDEIEKYLKPLQRNIQIAIERLNNAFLRRHIDDSILDVTIALEALFIESGENTEVTHKLATRTAALCKKFPLDSYTPFQVFKACKKIYAFRSAIVHSKEKKELDKSRNLKSETLPEISTVEAGIRLLSHSLNIILKHPELLNPEDIDKGLFDDPIL